VDSTGNMIASGSKDRHMRLWDAVGGVCVTTMPACLGEVTSVEIDREGRYVLAGCKDNSNRLWDLRMVCLLSFHQGGEC
jgi:COMPASS component SWD3